MNDFLAGAWRLVVRLLLVALGVVFFLSLLAAVLVLVAVWLVRAGWARLTGRPVTPWVMRMDPRSGFGTVFRAGERWTQPRPGHRGGSTSADDGGESAPPRRGGILPGAAEVTDVEAREPQR